MFLNCKVEIEGWKEFTSLSIIQNPHGKVITKDEKYLIVKKIIHVSM